MSIPIAPEPDNPKDKIVPLIPQHRAIAILRDLAANPQTLGHFTAEVSERMLKLANQLEKTARENAAAGRQEESDRETLLAHVLTYLGDREAVEISLFNLIFGSIAQGVTEFEGRSLASGEGDR